PRPPYPPTTHLPHPTPSPSTPLFFFFFHATAPTEIYTVGNTLSLHDALPIYVHDPKGRERPDPALVTTVAELEKSHRSEEHTSELQSLPTNSYAVFCLKKKNPDARTAQGAHEVDGQPRHVLSPHVLRCSCSNARATPDIYTVGNTLSLHDALPI